MPSLTNTYTNGIWTKSLNPKIYVKDHWVDLLDPSWADIQAMVQTGLHLIYFKIGDVLNVLYNGVSTPVVVIGLDHDIPTDPNKTHSMTLQFQDVIEEMQFDAKEALFACPNGLTAGTYHFTITQHPWVPTDVGKTIQLTLTNDIPADGCLVLQNAYNATVVGAKINSYATLSATTALESVTMTEGSDGTDLGNVSNSVSGNTNSLQRALLGSNNYNNYNESAIRQWLNSSEAAGSVWTPRTKWDRYPSWSATYSGFLSRLDPNLISVIGTCTKRTAKNTVTDGGGYADTTEKIFLMSRTEAFGDKENNVAEGSKYDIYTNNASRIKTKSGTAKYWWVRSPGSASAYYVRGVSPSGALYNYFAYITIGVVPAWIIC